MVLTLTDTLVDQTSPYFRPGFFKYVPREQTGWRRVLQSIAGKLPARVISTTDHRDSSKSERVLFMRYFLFKIPDWRVFGRWAGGQAYLHHYLLPDQGKYLHDHPWQRAVAIPLAGGYVERRANGFHLEGPEHRTVIREDVHLRRPGSVYFLKGSDFHTIHELIEDSSWSFFMHTPYSKVWGFIEASPEYGGVYFREANSPSTRTKGQWADKALKGDYYNADA